MPHFGHGYGFSPVCTRMCFLQSVRFMKVLQQMLQAYFFSPSTSSTWSSAAAFLHLDCTSSDALVSAGRSADPEEEEGSESPSETAGAALGAMRRNPVDPDATTHPPPLVFPAVLEVGKRAGCRPRAGLTLLRNPSRELWVGCRRTASLKPGACCVESSCCKGTVATGKTREEEQSEGEPVEQEV